MGWVCLAVHLLRLAFGLLVHGHLLLLLLLVRCGRGGRAVLLGYRCLLLLLLLLACHGSSIDIRRHARSIRMCKLLLLLMLLQLMLLLLLGWQGHLSIALGT